jgi:hypothetical protein
VGASEVGPFESRQRQAWVIQPLIDAGLELEEIRRLLFRLGFHAIVSAGRGTGQGLRELAAGGSSDVNAAWLETIDRMIASEPPTRSA